MYRWIYVDMCMNSFENCFKFDEKSFNMGGNIGPKSRKSVPRGTPKWRQEAKMIKRGGPPNSLVVLRAIFKENGLQEAKKSDIGGYGCARPLDFGAQGGGGRRAKPLLQGSWEERDWKE